jgi:hypothetical protein
MIADQEKINGCVRFAFQLSPFLKPGGQIKATTKLPNSEQPHKGKVKTHNHTNRQNQSTTGKL